MKRIFSIIGVGLIIFSCQPDNPQPTVTNSGTMTCTLNGSAWSATTFNNTLELNIPIGESLAKKMELMGQNSSGQQLTLRAAAMSNPGDDNMPVGAYLSTGSNLGGGVQYFGDGVNSGVSAGTNAGDAEIVITSFDQANHTCSGTFSFVLKDNQTGDTLYTGTNGQFTSLTFTVI